MRRIIGLVGGLALIVITTALPAHAGSAPNRMDKNISVFQNKPTIHNLLWDDDWNGHNTQSKKGDIHTFSKKLVDSDYIDGAKGYGVESFSFAETVDTASKPWSKCGSSSRAPTSVSATQVFDWAGCMAISPIKAGHSPTVRVPITNDLYVVYLPERTTITGALTIPGVTVLGKSYGPWTFVRSTSCEDYGAFHAVTLTILGLVPIAIVPTKCAITSGGGLTTITKAASHEIIEAITDTVPSLGWIDNDFPNKSPDYERYSKGEVSDFCSPGDEGTVHTKSPRRGGYYVAAYWSNAKNQCWPVAGS